MVLWDETFQRIAAEYPDVETESWLVDAMAARFVLRPETLEVVVASNLFGDILSDLGSAIAGSLGVAASANIDPERRRPSMFERSTARPRHRQPRDREPRWRRSGPHR
jgi:tartrate dehydrogenase/decarboxylase/D-malate dehydrogenase